MLIIFQISPGSSSSKIRNNRRKVANQNSIVDNKLLGNLLLLCTKRTPGTEVPQQPQY